MTSEAFSGKSEGKEHLTNALGGLIFLIGGYLIFTQINPNILNIDFSTASGRVEVVARDMSVDLEDSEGFLSIINFLDYHNFASFLFFQDYYRDQGLDGTYCNQDEFHVTDFATDAVAFVVTGGVLTALKGPALLTKAEKIASKYPKIAKTFNGVGKASNKNFFTKGLTTKIKAGMSVLLVDAANGTFNPDEDDEKADDYLACLKKKAEYQDKGYRVSDKCYAGSNTAVTARYCFNYNAKESIQRDIDKWHQTYPKKDYQKFCREMSPTWTKERIVRTAVGGKKVPYKIVSDGEKPKGLAIDIFTGAGLSSGRDWFSDHIGIYDEMCVAGKPLGDEYEVVTEGNGMNLPIKCEVGVWGSSNCKDKFKYLQNQNKIKKSCSFAPVYSRQDGEQNIAVKKECIIKK